VKDFLAANSLERVFPAPRLHLGTLQSLDWKRIRFRAPETFDDASPSRLRVEWAPPQEVALVAQRVASPLALADFENRLRTGRDFVGLGALAGADTREGRIGGRPAVIGLGFVDTGPNLPPEVSYAVLDLGKEKVVAAYTGPEVQAAFNRSVLDGWLASVEADPMLTAEVRARLPTALERVALGSGAQMMMPPAGPGSRKRRRPAAAWPPPRPCCKPRPRATSRSRCARLAFGVRGQSPEQAADGLRLAARGRAARLLRPAFRADGRDLRDRGHVRAAGDGLLQLEMVAPVAKEPFVAISTPPGSGGARRMSASALRRWPACGARRERPGPAAPRAAGAPPATAPRPTWS
jgi:hypothetical protein